METGRCVHCHERKGGFWSKAADGFCCRACYRTHHAPRERCGCCKRPNQLINARPDGVAYCEACYKREINSGPCALCAGRKAFHARDDRNRRICLECFEKYLKPLEPCMYCKCDTVPAYRGARNEGICRPCYHREVNHDICDACGNDLPVAARTPGGKPLCTHHCHLARSSA